MKTQSNEQIFAEIAKNGEITERQILLLKNRSTRMQKDVMNYDLLDANDIKVTEEQGEKGLNWLKKLQRKRKNNPFGYRENEIINNATAKDFTFRGFYDAGNGWRSYFAPIFELNGMEYVPYVNGEEIYIIG